MQQLIKQLCSDFPQFSFIAGEVFSWSSQKQAVIYKLGDDESAVWSLFHELGHATLGHANYSTDFMLLKMESEAWAKASELAAKYSHKIDGDHIQDCLDTYRDWLHKRSTCPTCGNNSFQKDSKTYSCFNCSSEWSVSQTRLCRPYRRLQRA